MGDLVFVRIANINHRDSKIGIVQCTLHFLNIHFVRTAIGLHGFLWDAAEDFVIDQFLDGWRIATNSSSPKEKLFS